MNTNNAPERAMQRKNTPTADELHWKSEYEKMAELCRQIEISSERIEFKLEDEIKYLKAQLVAAMQPQVSESELDEAYKDGFDAGFGEAKHCKSADVSADAVEMARYFATSWLSLSEKDIAGRIQAYGENEYQKGLVEGIKQAQNKTAL